MQSVRALGFPDSTDILQFLCVDHSRGKRQTFSCAKVMNDSLQLLELPRTKIDNIGNFTYGTKAAYILTGYNAKKIRFSSLIGLQCETKVQ